MAISLLQPVPSLISLSVKYAINNFDISAETAKLYLDSEKAPVIERIVDAWNKIKGANELTKAALEIENECLGQRSFSNEKEKSDFLKVNVYKLFANFAKKFEIPDTEVIPCDPFSYIQLDLENKALFKIWKLRLVQQLPFAEDESIPQTLLEIKRWFSDPRNSEKFNSVRSLNLGALDLKAVPRQISKFSNLKELSLFACYLECFPEFIGRFSQLQVLVLSYNKFTSLPESIWGLSELRVLNLEVNELTTIPASIDRLTSLEELNISYNNLKTIPESIGNLSQLRIWKLEATKIAILPETISHLQHLEKLHIDEGTIVPEINHVKELKRIKRLFQI